MQLNDIYIYALKELKGFDEKAIEDAILLSKNDVVETVEEFIDFVNFNIEERKFPQIEKPFDARVIKKAVDKARKNEGQIVHYVSVATGGYPQKLLQSQIGPLSALSYRGKLKNLERKTIMIAGSSSITNNAKLASKYFGKLFAANGYNILTSFSEGCEQNSILGCIEASGISTFFLPHSIEHLSTKEKKVIIGELEAGRSTLISASNLPKSNDDTIDDTYRYLTAISDCIIVPQLSSNDHIMQLIRKFLAANKPVYFIKYKTGGAAEYDCSNILTPLGMKYISSNTALKQIKEAIGEAGE
jgi:predicted Rossmann fold nucleotide-binding protein DprA/Smf involved in DNA uptake